MAGAPPATGFPARQGVETLEARLARGPLPAQEALTLLILAHHALARAHAEGTVHRDFKPGSLRIEAGGTLTLLDSGAAPADPGGASPGPRFTPAYAAPELLQGRAPDEGSDAWAFAVTAFQCLAGTLPFQGETAHAVLYQVAHGEPAFPEGLSPELRAVFGKALAKDPAARYPDLPSLAAALVKAVPLSEEARLRSLALLRSGLPRASRPGHDRLGRSLAMTLVGVILAVLAFLFWPRPRYLTVTTTPPGAQVVLDGIPLGQSPLRDLQIPRKARELRVTREGCLPILRTLAPSDRTLDLTLAAAPRPANGEAGPGFWKRIFGE